MKQPVKVALIRMVVMPDIPFSLLHHALIAGVIFLFVFSASLFGFMGTVKAVHLRGEKSDQIWANL